MIDSHIHIDELIKAIRIRIYRGMTRDQIAEDLGRFIPQHLIYLCYSAAKIMDQ